MPPPIRAAWRQPVVAEDKTGLEPKPPIETFAGRSCPTWSVSKLLEL